MGSSAKLLSLIAYAIAGSGLVYLVLTHELLATGPIGLSVQGLAALLMVWARTKVLVPFVL